MILPLRCGNGNRADVQQIASSLLAQRGDAITTEVGSVMWVETQAWARAIYSIWAVNQKMAFQFDPHKMTDFLPRWESILGIAALPTDTIQQRQARITARFLLVNKMPDTQAVTDLLKANLGTTFLEIINTPASTAFTQFPGGVDIIGGAQNVGNGPWYSEVQNIFVETFRPPVMTDNQFYATINQIFPLLNGYLPAYDTFDWFWDSFSDDGYASGDGYVGTISGTVGSFVLSGVGTSWNTPINAPDFSYNVVGQSILECFADNGTWQRLEVSSVSSDTSLTLANPLVVNITNKKYVIQGFFCDCDSTQFPYPPSNAKNLDNAGINVA